MCSGEPQDVVLVLGAGEVGLAVARVLLKRGRSVHVHCRREASLKQALERLPGGRLVGGSHGDLAFGATPLVVDGVEVEAARSFEDHRALYAGDVARQRLTSIIEVTGARSVVDCLNLATQLADPSSWPTDLPGAEDPTVRDAAGLTSSLAVVRGHALALDSWLYRNPGSNYVKVSTTGLGSRGLEAPFTHGDFGEVLSPALWRKLYISGANGQLLWALSRSFPGRVGLVIPAAFIGFEDVDEDPEQDSSLPSELVWAGEDRSYTCEELAVISSHHQMGTVTKAEVAEAVVRVLSGAGQEVDVLLAMNKAALPASDRGRELRHWLLERMRSGSPVPRPVSSGSLGKRVDVALEALRALRLAYGRTRPLKDLLLERPGSGSDPRVRGRRPAPGRGELLDWIAEVVQESERELPEEDVAELRSLLDSPVWGEGDLLALLWKGDRTRTALL